MNYELIYKTSIDKFRNQVISDDVYTEVHHIIPRHAGGDDSSENLIKITYRQHRFLHKVRYRAHRDVKDFCAYRLMYNISADKKRELLSMAGKLGGKKNSESGHMSLVGKTFGKINGKRLAESGFLDSIRHLANNETQLAKVTSLGKHNVASGRLAEISKKAWTAKWTDKARNRKSIESKVKYSVPANKQKLCEMSHKSAKIKADQAQNRSRLIIENAERNEEFLTKQSSKSLYFFVSPEGLIFHSPIFAANYYGNCKATIIEYWCKRFKYGWKVIQNNTSVTNLCEHKR